jgi:hypothetical protein
MLKGMSLIFVYVNAYIINKITLLRVNRPRRKSYGGLNSIR